MVKEHNIGISLLRIVMCFEIVIGHVYGYSTENRLFALLCSYEPCTVPAFMLLSFYLVAPSLAKTDYFVKRCKRMLIPHLFWTFLFFCVLYVTHYMQITEEKIDIYSLLWQLFTGHSYNAPMWFVVDLLALTLLYFIVLRYMQKHVSAICVSLLICSFILQYSGVMVDLLGDLRPEIRYPLGRLVKMIPYASTGVLLCHSGIINHCKNHRKTTIIVCLALLCVQRKIAFDSFPYTFGYGGLSLYISTLAIFMTFLVLPFNFLDNTIKKSLVVVSTYTFGVYCMHVPIAKLLIGIGRNGFDYDIPRLPLSLVVFVLCYIFAYSMSLTSNKIIRSVVQ